MHGISAHSAMAIKRQRRQRAHRNRGKPQTAASRQASMSNKVMGTITMFHVGAVFLTVGLFLLLAAIITNETNKAEIAELIGTGIVCLVIGLFLVILNRFYGQREEEELQNYVETRLARTRSGQRLYHEADSYPENLDANCSRSPSMDSRMSNDFAMKKNKKKDKKSKSRGPTADHDGEPTTSSAYANQTTVNIINEHNHNQPQNHQQLHKNNSRGGGMLSGSGGGASGGVDEISPGGVTLERSYEDGRHNPAYYNNSSSSGFDNDPSGLSRGGNLYRVYDSTTA